MDFVEDQMVLGVLGFTSGSSNLFHCSVWKGVPSFSMKFKIGKCDTTNVVWISQNCFGNSDCFVVHMNFSIVCLYIFLKGWPYSKCVQCGELDRGILVNTDTQE